MPNLKRKFILPTNEEDAAINVGIAQDPDTFEVSDEQFTRMARRGRPVATVRKEHITIRLSPDVLDRFRRTGAGWQTRIDMALRDWLASHPNI